MEKDWKKVFIADDEYRAEMLKMALEDESINSVVIDTRGATFPNFGTYDVYVHEQDVEMAEHVIELFLKNDGTE